MLLQVVNITQIVGVIFMNSIQPVIMAGGFGTRLWPMSCEVNSKQFIKILADRSLFQLTLSRNAYLGKPIVIVNVAQKEIAEAQIEEMGYEADIVIEPLQKNTAPCAIIASIYARNRNKAKVLLFPSDHYISNHTKYRASVDRAIAALEQHDICTIGIKPSTPHTGYGYIHVEDENKDNVRMTKGFIEKPSLELAKKLLEQSNYFWNSGIFFYDADFMLSMSDKFIPETLEMVETSINEKSHTLLAKEPYEKISPISIDYSIIQNLSEMAFIEADFDWHDVGNWDSLWKMNKKDHNLNHLEGNVLTSNVTNSFIKSDGPQTTVIGLSDVIVISNGGNILVAGREMAEDLKNIMSSVRTR
jgi:mannose-1-phosphate guanylyltransferase/mannose-6-phosphate isomerase